MLHKEENIH